LDQVGFYNPNTEPPEIRIDLDKVDKWQGQGAGVSHTVRSLIRKARRQ
jgi:small subunit ribosomal protein S16